jgi:hypothetical protein
VVFFPTTRRLVVGRKKKILLFMSGRVFQYLENHIFLGPFWVLFNSFPFRGATQ